MQKDMRAKLLEAKLWMEEKNFSEENWRKITIKNSDEGTN